MKCEFPVINQDMVGYESRWSYLVGIEKDKTEDPIGLDSGFYNCLIKIDHTGVEEAKITSFGPTHNGGEVFYH